MIRSTPSTLIALPLCACCAGPSLAGRPIVPERLYVGVNRPIIVEVDPPSGAGDTGGDAAPGPIEQSGSSRAARPASGLVEIALIDARSGDQVDRAQAEPGPVDLAAMFPVLWTTRRPRLLYAQVYLDGEPVGAACVLQPLVTPARATDALTSRTRDAIRSGNSSFLAQLVALAPGVKDNLAGQVILTPAPDGGTYSGLRCYTDGHVSLETSMGRLTIALRPGQAPNTCYTIRHLVEGGAYDGVAFHRVIGEDLDGNPYLLQAGDPTGTGLGGVGFHIDFEPSTIAHDYGVVSLARSMDDPNSGGSQFFICLSREACSGLDGLYTSFGEVVEGADVLDAIASVPVGPIDPEDPTSRHERPLAPPTIDRAELIDAPPFPRRPERIEQPEVGPVQR